MPKHGRKRHYNVKGRMHFAAPYVDGLRSWLEELGYTDNTIEETTRYLACWTTWMHASGYGIENILDGLAASVLHFKVKKSLAHHTSAGRLFVRYLQKQGTVPAPSPPSPTEVWPILAAFNAWARQHRGIAESTLEQWRRPIVELLQALGDDPGAYTANALRDFMLARSKRYKVPRLRVYAVAIRGFLRFLIADGRCPAGREYAIPTFANWTLASIPKHLPAEDVERAITACEGRPRDKAIVLLLARLGLRAGEVAKLKVADIDWKNGRISVMGKSRRAEQLPLTQEVGDAIIAYIEQARPHLRTPALFLTERAPLRPMTRTTVKCIVRRTLRRAGIQSPHNGAHVLRHSAATAMLRCGVSLGGVGAVLRHTSPAMTMHYAKIDFDLLSDVAQPWPGRLPC